MAVDLTTTYLGFPLIGTGNQENNWINTLNTDFFDAVEGHLSEAYDLGTDRGGGNRQINGERLLVHVFHYDPGGELLAPLQITLDFDLLPPTITKRSFWFYDGSTGETVSFRVTKGGVTGSYTQFNKGVSIIVIDGTTVYALPEYQP